MSYRYLGYSQNISTQKVVFDIAIELENVEFIPGKIRSRLVLGPIALSNSELVAKKNTPKDGLGDGSPSLGLDSADDDQYLITPLGSGKEHLSLRYHLIPPSPLSTQSSMSPNRSSAISHHVE